MAAYNKTIISGDTLNADAIVAAINSDLPVVSEESGITTLSSFGPATSTPFYVTGLTNTLTLNSDELFKITTTITYSIGTPGTTWYFYHDIGGGGSSTYKWYVRLHSGGVGDTTGKYDTIQFSTWSQDTVGATLMRTYCGMESGTGTIYMRYARQRVEIFKRRT